MTDEASPVLDLPEVVKVAEDLAAGRREDLDDCVDVILAGLRTRLGFDITFVGRFTDGHRVVRSVDSGIGEVLPVGASDPLQDSFCARVADGRMPEFVPDARTEPAARELAATRSLPVGTHLSVPIQFSDGAVYGTLCGFTRVPDPHIEERDLGIMRLLARLLGRYLENEQLGDDERDRTCAQVEAVIVSGGPRVVFQPVRDLTTLSVVGYEALSRFDDGGLPDAWFARAATVGLGVELEVSALHQALSRLDVLPCGTYVAVNLSPAAICSDALPDVLAGTRLDQVVLELTEQTGVPDYGALRERVAWLRGRGGRVAVDDAGAGYAGLQRILEMAPDVIKLDRALVRDLAADQARQALVSALTWFAERTGATLVAEGVETQDQVVVLRELGVPLGQGFHLGRPAVLV